MLGPQVARDGATDPRGSPSRDRFSLDSASTLITISKSLV